jgi:hypothetical protein
MTPEDFKKNLKQAFEELAKEANLKMSQCSVHLTDTDLSFQVSMSGDVKGFLTNPLGKEESS